MKTFYKQNSYLLTAIFFLNGCINAQQQNVNLPVQEKLYYRIQEGGQILVNIDRKTPLEILINKLDENWKLLETGKGY